jgi:hypothetical protein
LAESGFRRACILIFRENVLSELIIFLDLYLVSPVFFSLASCSLRGIRGNIQERKQASVSFVISQRIAFHIYTKCGFFIPSIRFSAS